MAKFSAVLMATVENERWAPVKKQLIIKLKEASEYLTREIHKLFEQIPDEGRVDDLPTLDEQSWQIFLDSAKDVYNSVHQHDILSSEKYPLELFADILYYTIKQAACSENYLEEQLKRCLFPEEGVIDFGEDICRKFSTGAKKYREQLNSR